MGLFPDSMQIQRSFFIERIILQISRHPYQTLGVEGLVALKIDIQYSLNLDKERCVTARSALDWIAQGTGSANTVIQHRDWFSADAIQMCTVMETIERRLDTYFKAGHSRSSPASTNSQTLFPSDNKCSCYIPPRGLGTCREPGTLSR